MFNKGKHQAGWAMGRGRPLAARTRVLLVIGAVLAVPAATLVGVAESGASNNPVVVVQYTPSTIPLNGTSTLSINIQNPDSSNPMTGIAFSDTFPSGSVVAATPDIVGSCGSGIFVANAGTDAVSLNGGTLPESGSCTVSVNVTGTSPSSGTNTIDVAATDNGSPEAGSGSAQLTVQPAVTANPKVVETYTPSSIPLNGTSTLAVNIQNPDAMNPMTGIDFSDTFPSGSIISTPADVVGSCGAGVFVANPGSSSISLTGGNLAASGECTISVNVTGVAASSTANPITVTATDNGQAVSGTGSATLTVAATAALNPVVTVNYTADSIPLGDLSTLTISIKDPDTVNAMTQVAFVDKFPTGSVVATPADASGTCGSGNFVTNSGQKQISLTGGSLAPDTTCTLSVQVLGKAESVETNKVTVTATDNGGPTSGTASAVLTVVGPPVLTMTNKGGATTIPLNHAAAGAIVFLIKNTNTTTELTGVAFTATLPAGLVIAGGAAAIPFDQAGNCGTAPELLTTTATTVALSGAQVAKNGKCQFAFKITGVEAGVWTTSAPSITSNEGGTGPGASTSIIVDAPPVVQTETVTTSPIADGATITLSVTLQNTNTTPLTGVGFSDTLPNEVEIATPPGTTNTCAGTLNAAAASTEFDLSGVKLAGSSTCVVTVQIIGVNAGSDIISTTPVSNEGGTGVAVTTPIQVIAIYPVLPSTVDQNVTGCRPFSESFSDGIPGTVYTETGVFPAGLSLSPSTGLISGTPTSYGQYSVTIVVTPPYGGTVVTHGYVFFEELCISPFSGTLPNGSIGTHYSTTLGGLRGTAPYRFQIQGPGIAPGLALSTTGVLSGIPTNTGTYTFTVDIFDSSSPVKTGVATFTIVIS